MNATSQHYTQQHVSNELIIENSALPTVKRDPRLKLKYIPKVDINTNDVISIEPSVFFVHRDNISQNVDFNASGSYQLSTFKIFVQSLEHSIKDCIQWDKIGNRFNLSINTPAEIWMNSWSVSFIHKVMEANEITANRLTINIYPDHTDLEHADFLCNLASLDLMGIKLCLSNYGGNATALSALSSIKFDEVRVDKSVTQKVAYSKKHTEVLRQMVILAHELNIKVTADGVKYSFQKEILEECGVDYIQGEYLNRPVTADEITLFLSKFRA